MSVTIEFSHIWTPNGWKEKRTYEKDYFKESIKMVSPGEFGGFVFEATCRHTRETVVIGGQYTANRYGTN